MAKKKLILDLDTGIDDALAIAYAVASEEADLIGVTSTYGNVVTKQAAANSLRILDLLGQSNVPVYLGLPHPSTSNHFDVMAVSQAIHGVNGIGEVALEKSQRQPENESAVDFMIRSAKTYGTDLTIIPTGPMTNLAAAIAKAPELTALVGSVTFMGGALTVPGNVTEVGEANINQDPAAADAVLRSSASLTMVGLDVTLRTLLTRKETKLWRSLGTKSGQAFADIVDYYIAAYARLSANLNGCALHDPLAVGVALDPDLVQTIDLNMKVETEAPFAARTVGDVDRLNEPTNVKVAVNVAAERFLQRFMQRLTWLFAQH
ncbi:nucleoside hydrolase [Loigolactobacillus backii]|uniref:Nucleoside hydrolase n=1 Tax=Loigolactobacillus backii TaxID=375175 RepID=A0A192H3W5_9LACO|nr:nucleoside hydrolase [Loigolactobacillus backii]ANK59248.1 nucleoside hydrolase [Loigolactobacillus backii]ANK62661.1 nucleoside hydrolase [Loigolactobacillus backii]ANK64239.1 nucleoside hydrolase [Loigolactobacillus backii]ANK67367.1 nucleoside hydrolase [Loigolactobacillus backii]ANK70331.1 nucleoside hydrolase [Loigolactobacillus backii]